MLSCISFQNITFQRLDSVSVFQVRPTQLVPLIELVPISGLEKNKQDGILDKGKTTDNVQKRNICTNVPLSRIFNIKSFFEPQHHIRYNLLLFFFLCLILTHGHTFCFPVQAVWSSQHDLLHLAIPTLLGQYVMH
jgi:hypothetical protein